MQVPSFPIHWLIFLPCDNIQPAIPTGRLFSITHLLLNLTGQVLPLFSVVIQQLWHPLDTSYQLHSARQVTVLCAHSWSCWTWRGGSSGWGAGGCTGYGGAATGAASCLCLSHLQQFLKRYGSGGRCRPASELRCGPVTGCTVTTGFWTIILNL